MTNTNPPGLAGSKPALQSVTVWGMILTFLSAVLPFVAPRLGWTTQDQSDILNLLGQAGDIVGAAIVLFGRLRATTTISGILPKGTSGTTTAAILALGFLSIVLMGGGGMLTACSTAGAAGTSTTASSTQQTAATAMLYAETLYNAAANAELDAKASGFLSAAQVTQADSYRAQAYQVLLGLRAAYKAGTTPDPTSLLALVNQILVLAGKSPVTTPVSS